ncbi:hypothetical protein [Streptomyces sp. NPDC055709]
MLLLGESLWLTFNEQQVIKQDPKSQLAAKHPGSAEREVELVNNVSVYLVGSGKRVGKGHVHSLPHQVHDLVGDDVFLADVDVDGRLQVRIPYRGCRHAATVARQVQCERG